MNAEQFQQLTNVSRETLDKLTLYVQTLQDWQKNINLISATTIDDIWQRHIHDSWQLIDHIRNVSRETSELVVADIGSGAGFPGMVLAILQVGQVHLIEQDQKKAAFLREINRLCGANAIIHAANVSRETLAADVITCRALATVAKILDMTSGLRKPDTTYLLLKSHKAAEECAEARKSYDFKQKIYPSVTDSTGRILELTNVTAR